jgi:transcription elongation factor GreA
LEHIVSTQDQSVWLTQEAYDRLASELEYLVTVARHEISKKIQDAREEGDLKENGGYHAAKEEQGKIESRIDRIENILALATVGDAPASHGVVEQGVVVKVLLRGDETEFLLGSAEIAEGTDLTVYSPSSPIGAAIMGKSVGETVNFFAPNGKAIEVKILEVKNFTL